jgi:hypothetical protein
MLDVCVVTKMARSGHRRLRNRRGHQLSVIQPNSKKRTALVLQAPRAFHLQRPIVLN